MTPLPIASVRREADAFRCVRLPGTPTLSARACISRQARAAAATSTDDRLATHSCRDCADGRGIAERVGPIAIQAAPTAAALRRRGPVEPRGAALARLRADQTAARAELDAELHQRIGATTHQSASEKEKSTVSKTPTCPVDGCAESPARATRHCPPDLAPLCKRHRRLESWRRADARKRAKKGATPRAEIVRATVPSSEQPADLHTAVRDLLGEALEAVRLVRALGGVERVRAFLAAAGDR